MPFQPVTNPFSQVLEDECAYASLAHATSQPGVQRASDTNGFDNGACPEESDNLTSGNQPSNQGKQPQSDIFLASLIDGVTDSRKSEGASNHRKTSASFQPEANPLFQVFENECAYANWTHVTSQAVVQQASDTNGFDNGACPLESDNLTPENQTTNRGETLQSQADAFLSSFMDNHIGASSAQANIPSKVQKQVQNNMGARTSQIHTESQVKPSIADAFLAGGLELDGFFAKFMEVRRERVTDNLPGCITACIPKVHQRKQYTLHHLYLRARLTRVQ